jgi:hypothetical protein
MELGYILLKNNMESIETQMIKDKEEEHTTQQLLAAQAN